MPTEFLVHISLDNGNRAETVCLSHDLTPEQVRSLLFAAAEVKESPRDVLLKLKTAEGALMPIGPHIVPNDEGSKYRLEVKKASMVPEKATSTSGAATEVLWKDVNEMKAQVTEIKDSAKAGITHTHEDDISSHMKPRPAIRRVQQIRLKIEEPLVHHFPSEVTENLKHPTFDVWQWQDSEMVGLLEHMFQEFGLIETFKIDRERLHRHCFCVTQMMYGLLHVTGVHEKLTPLEKLVLLTACIGHDLDHPGFNNAYQINANTELAIIYNDVSPLESHHSAVLFTILKNPETSVLSNLSDADYKEVRKQIIQCILATDMAKHGEILAKFKGYAEAGFNYDDPAQRQLLLQIIVKCSDISNEVRPKHVSEPWVDSLLEEFFTQSDREKAEGLPTAPFMDRQKVTKASAQVGFIGFVMIPLFELVSKVLPNMEEPVIQPIRKALEYYKSLLEKQAP
ncbi:High affinity cAMP-specific and IBMX-insensitive 3',5'-cyclic phosphodiesterase 9A [Borealophlyctis nickersoniae]|nr:High affinity cAMP-specific and IBMX-insensitive 3',5'-cyclic phosphodiesterase 9A [Borealophlyctis nickersoniae]